MLKNLGEKTKIYIADTSCFLDDKLFEEYYRSLSLNRRAKVDRMKMQEDKLRGLAAGVLLQKAYCDFCKELAASSLNVNIAGFTLPEIASGKNGKPYFIDSPIHFNLSHSGRRVMCAISTDEVGCDVEYKTQNSNKIARRFFSKEEVDYIESSDEDVSKRFTTVWTLKESVLKASGCGISYPMNEFSVVGAKGICEKLSFPGDGLDYYLINYPTEDEYGFSSASRVGNFDGIHNIIF